MTLCLQGSNDPELVLRIDARVDGHFHDGIAQFGVRHRAERSAIEYACARWGDLELFRDRHGCLRMISGDHEDANRRATAVLDGLCHLGAGRIDHCLQPEERETRERCGECVALSRRCGDCSRGHGQDAPSGAGQIVRGSQGRRTIEVLESWLGSAEGSDGFWCTLHEYD